MLGKKKNYEKKMRFYIDGVITSRGDMRITEALCNVSGLSYIDVNRKKSFVDCCYMNFISVEQVRTALGKLGYKISKVEDIIQ
ncbi:MAG: hypothetical protein LUD51_06780 [Clostridia bacterium]|nr:hypothetical protein [Clostridia bacterium]